ncbi:hypothetical protein EVAR_11262_1 [Eumeta japonica]|uniref:Uncharacterized protein n=1 Tax=Eumeta variegata TaxID=151549 RepID=A0A4C1ULQ0_EUMVA|nr:hypothetical protein EVAR_11262_1 [Eumeta japonica]
MSCDRGPCAQPDPKMHLRRFAYAYRITSAYTHARLLSLYRVLFTRLSEPFTATVDYLKLSCFDFKAQEHLRDSGLLTTVVKDLMWKFDANR